MANNTLPANCWSRTPYYRPGGKLSAEQLNASQTDSLMRDRLINVSMHGVGVAFGYEIRTDDHGNIVIDNNCIHISCGLAFDKYGRMLLWPGGWIKIQDIIGNLPNSEGKYTLYVHYAEKSDTGDAFDPCDEGADWIDRCVAFTLQKYCTKLDCCAPDVDCQYCMTQKEWICTRNGFHSGVVPMDEQLKMACADVPKLSSSDCGKVSYDPDAGLALSCLSICDLDQDKHDCDPRFDFCPCTPVQSCEFRPVAYRNPLLFELINKDDVRLSKIASYSWSDWRMKSWSDQYRVPFNAFKRRAMACQADRKMNAADGFSLMFSCPVQKRTLHPLSVLMEIYIRENRPYYWKPSRIPIKVLHLDEHGDIVPENDKDDCHDDENECVWGLVICPLQDWIKYELEDTNSTILDCASRGQLARVEITLRGQLIRDCCDLMIDARPPDIDEDDPCKNRAGQARPGDDWISVFRVGPDSPPGHGYDDGYDKTHEYSQSDSVSTETSVIGENK